MHMFGQRGQRRTKSAGLYGNAGQSYSTANLQAPQHSNISLSMAQSPPPPYNAVDPSYLQPFQPQMSEYGSPFQSQQYLPVMPAASALSPYASASTLDLPRPQTSGGWAQEQAWQNTQALAVRPASSGQNACMVARGLNQGVAFCDRVTTRLNDLLARPDDPIAGLVETGAPTRDLASSSDESLSAPGRREHRSRSKSPDEKEKSSNGVINWKKTWLYQNSRLPPGMLPFNAYLPTWTLVCRAAKASLDVYTRPPKGQRDYFTDADPRQGTKATIIKSQGMDDRNLIVVAIRGSQWKRVDWLVNFALAPTEPVDFLDDRGNACHAGFLECARAMIHPVAEQLKDLIQRDPSCATSSLLFTGHSAGGAVASLLYMHMNATSIKPSELTEIAGVFKRIHCVTFGTPPLSLLPLQKPYHPSRAKDVFLTFANEGDLIVRISSPYFASLVKALAASPPSPPTATATGRPKLCQKVSRQHLRGGNESKAALPARWPVPDATLSNAGRLVLLREKPKGKNGKVEGVQLTDAQLREVFFGDPAMHSMTLYKQRVDELAFAAVSGSDAG